MYQTVIMAAGPGPPQASGFRHCPRRAFPPSGMPASLVRPLPLKIRSLLTLCPVLEDAAQALANPNHQSQQLGLRSVVSSKMRGFPLWTKLTLPAHLSYSGATIRVSLNTCKDWNTFSTGFSLEQWEERLLFDLQSCLFYGCRTTKPVPHNY